jgi:hypothetical protein
MTTDDTNLIAVEQLQINKDLLVALQELRRSTEDLRKQRGAPPPPRPPFNPVETARRQIEQQRRREQVKAEYEKLNPPTSKHLPVFDATAQAQKQYEREQQREQVKAEYQKLNPPQAIPVERFDATAQAQKQIERQRQQRAVKDEIERLAAPQAIPVSPSRGMPPSPTATLVQSGQSPSLLRQQMQLQNQQNKAITQGTKQLSGLGQVAATAGQSLFSFATSAVTSLGITIPLSAAAFASTAVGFAKSFASFTESAAAEANPQQGGTLAGSKKSVDIAVGEQHTEFQRFQILKRQQLADEIRERGKSKGGSWGAELQAWEAEHLGLSDRFEYHTLTEGQKKNLAGQQKDVLQSGAGLPPTRVAGSAEEYYDSLLQAGGQNGPLENKNLLDQITNMTKAIAENTAALDNHREAFPQQQWQ